MEHRAFWPGPVWNWTRCPWSGFTASGSGLNAPSGSWSSRPELSVITSGQNTCPGWITTGRKQNRRRWSRWKTTMHAEKFWRRYGQLRCTWFCPALHWEPFSACHFEWKENSVRNRSVISVRRQKEKCQKAPWCIIFENIFFDLWDKTRNYA